MAFTETEIRELEEMSKQRTFPVLTDIHRSLLSRVAHYLRSGGVAAEGEPVFSVLGRDEFCQATILFWMGRAKRSGVNEQKIERARERYNEVVEWQSDNPDRVHQPD